MLKNNIITYELFYKMTHGVTLSGIATAAAILMQSLMIYIYISQIIQ